VSQIETTKVVPFVVIGANADEIAASKVIMYLVLEPGEQAAGDTTRQGHIHAQVIRRG
jgi:hypothetical protein